MSDPTPSMVTSVSSSPSGETPPFVRAEDLHKTYVMGKRRLEVLCGVSLVLERGEFLALRGASGAGKSTLLHLIGGLDSPNQGMIEFMGRRLNSMDGKTLAAFRIRHVGFVFQAYHLLPDLSALENVCLPGRIARRGTGEVESQARALLDRVGLNDREEHKPSELSGGEQQRVAIARALINDPELLLADEPTGNLDSHTGSEIIELLRELRVEKKTTLLIATHDSKVAAEAPRMLDLKDGRIG